MRLAMVYALMDHSRLIRAEHLMAGLALWQYAEQSAAYAFGNALGDPTADEILRVLKQHPDGMTRTELRDHFRRHKSAEEITSAVTLLLEYELAKRTTRRTQGRHAEVWRACA